MDSILLACNIRIAFCLSKDIIRGFQTLYTLYLQSLFITISIYNNRIQVNSDEFTYLILLNIKYTFV